jgi:hypothetical protein
MILPIDIKPEQSLYYIGATAIYTMKSQPLGRLQIDQLFRLVKDSINSLSFQQFLFSLDWLFLVGLVESDEQGIFHVSQETDNIG